MNKLLSFLFIATCFFAKAQQIQSLEQALQQESPLLFSAEIKQGKHEHAGILVFNKKNDTTNVALVSPVGMSIFGLSVMEKGYEFTYLPSFLDRKGFKYVLGNDFMALTQSQITSSEKKLVKRINKKKTKYYFKENTLVRITQKQGIPGKMKATCTYLPNGQVDKLCVHHKRINFELKLNRLKN